ncbi:hypothetical protein QA596_07375 [Balneolales bacterium ANBcel1]|nr:hypothetical protein [Balneolales bacterium ANBcel1]
MIRLVRLFGTLLLLSLFMQSCSTTLRSSWRDFNAYFNTYYNAKTSFERGLETQEQQTVEINPERPIRVHVTPRQAGQNDFAHAAEKAADVIRFHPQSRWVDNAIKIIGMSFYYRQQYFSADQKFVELLASTTDPTLRQEAIMWRGKAALEMENYSEGINFLQSRLFSSELDWDPKIEAGVKLLIAQMYVLRGEYEDAEVYMAEALPEIGERDMRMRAYFLHGQILEKLERFDEAFESYAKATHRSNQNYDLLYHAERKMGVVARLRGDLEWAYDHFSSMSRDDRHFGYMAAIEYEIARTLQEQASYTAAKRRYEYIFEHRTMTPPPELQSRIYYGLAEIYRDFYQDYTLAAAYYDSSAQQATNRRLLPENFDADIMASSFGEYSRLKAEVHHLDSLLWLGSLSPEERDSVIAEVRAQQIAEMEEEARRQNRARMVSVDGIEEAGAQADEHTDNGFLNHLNPQIMQQMSQAFQAYWGQRALVDDWRRMDMVRVNIVRQAEEGGEEVEDVDEVLQEMAERQAPTIQIDLSGVPFTEEEQQETRHRIASYEYEIGNVFFTSLAMPDSAATYFRSVMGRFPDSELAPQAIYSLSELYHAAGDTVQALQYAMQLTDFYPGTIFARRMSDRYMLDLEIPEEEMSREDSLSQVYNRILSYEDPMKRAEQLRRFVVAYPDFEKAADALYRAVNEYVAVARQDEQYNFNLYELSTVESIWRQERATRESMNESIQAMLADTTFMEMVNAYTIEPAVTDTSETGSSGGLQDDGAGEETESQNDAGDPEEYRDSETETANGTQNRRTERGRLLESANSDPYRSADAQEVSENLQADTLLAAEEPEDTTDYAEATEEAHEADESDSRQMDEKDEEAAEEAVAGVTTEELFRDILSKELQEPDFSEWFPYEGAYWDSARVAVFILQSNYPDFPRRRVVTELAREIDADRAISIMVDPDRVHECGELESKPEIIGGFDATLEQSGLQDVIDAYLIRGSVTLSVLIDPEGSPVEIDFADIDLSESAHGLLEPGTTDSNDEENVEALRENPDPVADTLGNPPDTLEQSAVVPDGVTERDSLAQETEAVADTAAVIETGDVSSEVGGLESGQEPVSVEGEPDTRDEQGSASDESDAGEFLEGLRRAVHEHLRFNPPAVFGVSVPAQCEYHLEFEPRSQSSDAGQAAVEEE